MYEFSLNPSISSTNFRVQPNSTWPAPLDYIQRRFPIAGFDSQLDQGPPPEGSGEPWSRPERWSVPSGSESVGVGRADKG